MNREQKLRNLILDRYTSFRQFAIVILICKKLDIDPFKI